MLDVTYCGSSCLRMLYEAFVHDVQTSLEDTLGWEAKLERDDRMLLMVSGSPSEDWRVFRSWLTQRLLVDVLNRLSAPEKQKIYSGLGVLLQAENFSSRRVCRLHSADVQVRVGRARARGGELGRAPGRHIPDDASQCGVVASACRAHAGDPGCHWVNQGVVLSRLQGKIDEATSVQACRCRRIRREPHKGGLAA